MSRAKIIASTTAIAILLAGCASRTASMSSDIEAAYVSPVLYQHLSCKQLATEYTRVETALLGLTEEQDKTSKNDRAKNIASFTPLVGGFFKESIKGDGVTTANLARAKGELAALWEVQEAKKCVGRAPKKSLATAKPCQQDASKPIDLVNPSNNCS